MKPMPRTLVSVCILVALVFLALLAFGALRAASASPVAWAAVVTAEPCEGDVNGDGIVNISDFLLVGSRLGARLGDRRYEARFDLNQDKRITAADLLIVWNRLGTRCVTGTPTNTPIPFSATPTATSTATPIATSTPTATAATLTASPTATSTSTVTATATATSTATSTATTANTATATASASATATEAPTATGTATATATSTPNTGLPPDPAAVAPPIDQTLATDILTSTAFLYTGANPIQTGVPAGTIKAQRVAILRGRVLDRAGQPIAGVAMSVLDHPEFGQTLSRVDGMFDMAVNGGGALTLNYEKLGYMTAHRAIDAPWQDFAWAPDVVLAPYDSAVTTIDLTAPAMQTARGSEENDADGARRATLLIPQGTTASMILPDGSTQPISTLHIRATEFTVGDNGPQAMPAELPPSSGYTYAVELSADEAVAAGAERLNFSQPLPVYLENFVGFPVGGAVPAGYYDRERGAWVASVNGRVVKVVGITGGQADLDITGDGVADDAAAIGVTTPERERLAALYTAGTELWRVPVTHFTPWDFNWPYGPPPDSIDPPAPKPKLGIPQVDDPCITFGSIIGCENQSLGESVAVTGADSRLHYQSQRTPGRKDIRTVEIVVSGPAPVPTSLIEMRVEVTVAGRQYVQTFSPAQNITYPFVWDSKDAYGRPVIGTRTAQINVEYDYQPQYYPVTSDVAGAFARPGFGIAAMFAARETGRITATRSFQAEVGGWDARASGIGGWDLSMHHAYDPTARTLLLGDGGQRTGDSIATIITTAGGNGVGGGAGGNGDGGLATLANMEPRGIAAGPDGTLYVVSDARVRKIAPDGTITTYAGGNNDDADDTGENGFKGDGGQAVLAKFNVPFGVALGPDGSLYIADTENHRIRRVAPNGIITTFAGNGAFPFGGFAGDGGPATAASLRTPYGVAVGPDGSVYIADSGNARIRRVGTDGIINTFAGYGTPGLPLPPVVDNAPATTSGIHGLFDVAMGPDGSLYLATAAGDGAGRIRRITPDGIITTVAGGGPYASPSFGDGGPATSGYLQQAWGIAIAPDGGIYVATGNAWRVRYVSPDGIITTIAGHYPDINYSTVFEDYRPALGANIRVPWEVALAPDGTLYVSEVEGNRVRRVAPALPGIAISDVLLPSQDGLELFVFNSAGRHLRTLDALTGAVRHQFAYDADGYLASITDGSGNVTTIERSAGVATAIVAPGGQRTELTVNGDGWLTRAENPAGEAYTMTSSPDGLLQTFTDPMTSLHTFTYDVRGRLILDEDPAGGSTALGRTELSNGYMVTTTSALGSVHTYKMEILPTGQLRRTAMSPGGATTTLLINQEGSRVLTHPDGVQITSTSGPDPRFGMMAPRLVRRTRTVPGVPTETLTGQRIATFADPGNLMSLQTLTDTFVVNSTRTFTRSYDAATLTLTETSPEGRQTVTVLDALGRIVSHRAAPTLTPMTFVYDASGRLSEEHHGALSMTYGYDALNRMITRTDAAGLVTGFAYDDADRVTMQTLPSGKQYEFDYDANGNRTGVTMPDGAIHALGHTAIDLESSYTPPGNASYQRAYNTDHELTEIALPGGRTTVYSYDALDRVSGVSYAEGATQFSYAGGDLTDRVSVIANAPAGGPNQDITFTYSGSLISTMAATGASPANVTYSYSNNFFPVSMGLTSVADSVTTALTFDRDGLATGFGPFTFNRTGPAGAPGTITDAASSAAYGYDALGRLSTRSRQVAGQARYAVQVGYDGSGRLSSRTETVNGVAHSYVYTYDLDGQLTRVERDGVITEQYAYDLNGNRTSSQSGASPVELASYDAQDRLTVRNGITYQFNADGFLAQRGADTFQYDTRGQLRGATIGGVAVSYAYDGLGRRVSRTDASGTYAYIYGDPASHLVTATRDQAGVFTFYYYDTDGLLIALDRGGARYYVTTDQVGTPRIITDAAAAVVRAIESDAFGVVITDSNPAFEMAIGYGGGLSDAATGLVHFGFRDYEPASGRWATRDPIGFDGGQGNLYAYVGNSPAQHRDPLGLFCISATGYNGVGGGVSVCITDEGASACVEAGFGVGVSVGVDVGGGLEKTGTAIVAEASFKTAYGLLEIGAGVSLDSSGCLTATPKGQIGPVTLEPGKAGLDIDSDFKPPESFKNGVEAKVAAKGCYQGKW